MIRGIYNSAAGMLPRYVKLVNISNNLANASTTSFKADRRYFTTILNSSIVQPGKTGKPANVQELDKGLYVDFRQGAINPTGNDTDFALNGDGFFVVEDPESGDRYYTRDGRFKLNNSFELVTSEGYKVLDDSGSGIIVRDKPFFVDQSGKISIRGQGTSSFMLAKFKDNHDLIKKGDNMYDVKKKGTEPETPEEIKVLQGNLEASNVNVVEEMVHMIELNKNFESSQRALTAQDQSLADLINKVPKF